MPKPRRLPPQIVPSETTDATGTADPDPVDGKYKIDTSGLYDTNQIKRLLDEELSHFMEASGYAESTLVVNIRILLGSIAVVAACYSHFGAGEFPANRDVVLACVVTYVICSTLISLLAYMVEANAVFVGTRKAQTVWIHTTMNKKGESTYTIEIRDRVRKEGVKITLQYESFITQSGCFLPHAYKAFLANNIPSITAKKSN